MEGIEDYLHKRYAENVFAALLGHYVLVHMGRQVVEYVLPIGHRICLEHTTLR